MRETRRLIITGTVQGVGFRYSMMAQARLRGISGWVRNRRDGSVEAVIAGSAAQIDEMLSWCRNGPAGATVGNIMIEAASGEFPDFELKPTG